MDTIFHKIIRKELPAKVEHEDDDCIVIHNIDPKAPVHVLVIPKKDLKNLSEMSEEDKELMGKLMLVARQMAEKLNIIDGFKVSINNGKKAGQSVMQLHIHLLGGWKHSVEGEVFEDF